MCYLLFAFIDSVNMLCLNCICFFYVSGEVVNNHDELMSNFFAQPDALAYGKVPP